MENNTGPKVLFGNNKKSADYVAENKAATAEPVVAPANNTQVSIPQVNLPTDIQADEAKVKVAEAELSLDPVKASNSIIAFGSKAQAAISSSSNALLKNVKAKDSGEIGKLLTDLTVNCKRIDIKDFMSDGEEKKGFFGQIIRKGKEEAQRFLIKYEDIEKGVNGTEQKLGIACQTMMGDVAFLDQQYKDNIERLHWLEAYIVAGRRKLAGEVAQMISEAQLKAQQTQDPMDIQNISNIQQMKNMLEKQIHDLELSRAIAIQSAPQIKLIQAGDMELAQKLKSSILNTIPLWRQQFTIGLTLIRQKAAAKLQKEVTDTTNKLLETNADLLNMGVVAIAKESERGIVDVSTIEHVNNKLLSTIDEVQKIREEGSKAREAASLKLIEIEGQLKNKLLAAH